MAILVPPRDANLDHHFYMDGRALHCMVQRPFEAPIPRSGRDHCKAALILAHCVAREFGDIYLDGCRRLHVKHRI